MTAKRFSEMLKSKRKEKGYRQRDLGEILGYSEKTVSKWERGASTPPVEVLPKIAAALGCDMNALFEYHIEPSYFLGIDGGGTKTAFLLADRNGEIIRRAALPASNPVDIGIEKTRAVLSEGIATVLCGIPNDQVSVFAGIAGGTTGYQEAIHGFLGGFHFGCFDNGSDLENALYASLGDGDGIVSILGTGNITIAVKDGVRHRFGGYGYFFDEGGSGFDIGRAGISAALKAREGSAGETLLLKLCNEKAGGSVFDSLADIYNGGKAYVAGFAGTVLEAVSKGDRTACTILENSMRNYAEVLKCAVRLYEGQSVPVYLTGGLSENEAVRAALGNFMREIPEAEIRRTEHAPVEGALYLARRIAERNGQ